MLKFKLYRRIRVLLGARSFVKYSNRDRTYAIVSGYGNLNDIINELEQTGFKEEWGKSD